MRRLLVVAVAWFGAAIALGLSGSLVHAPFLVPVMTFGAVTAVVVAYLRDGELRRVADDIDLRWPLLLHGLRAPIGALILLDMERGVMPALFANRAGPGDIAIGVLALVVVAFATPPTTTARRTIIAVWSIAGIADLALAFGTAQYLFFVVGDERMKLVADLPYTLLPAFIVPIMILTHFLILNRLRASSRAGAARRDPAR